MSNLDPDELIPPAAALVAHDAITDRVMPVVIHSADIHAAPGEGYVVREEVSPLTPMEHVDAVGHVEPWQYPLPKVRIFRHPNFADASLFLVCLTLGVLISSAAVGAELYFHWHGLRSIEEASKSTTIALATQLIIYVIGLVVAVPFFRKVWGQGYFEGLHWHGATAFRRRYWLMLTAVACNGLAMVGNAVLPFPKNAPIDQLFSTPKDAWMLAVFGVTIAPFFEEMIFRGFLLPAVATAWDWCVEKITGQGPRSLDAHGNPLWSTGAMIFASLMVSAPFALMHSAQVGKAWGPLVVLYCVSLVLCTVRLVTRSLASSTLVHSFYNLMLFAIMFWQTDGFRHMDKM
jgi:membrane protease YdiL (CAAX protease family)